MISSRIVLASLALSSLVCSPSFAKNKLVKQPLKAPANRCEVTGCGCEITGFGYNGMSLILNKTGAQSFYLIRNKSNRPIELVRIKTPDVFMSPPLRAKLQPENWAAFASDVENLPFQCAYMENDIAEVVDCFKVLDVCQYPRAKFAASNMGNYWVSTDHSKAQVIKDSVANGIYLHW